MNIPNTINAINKLYREEFNHTPERRIAFISILNWAYGQGLITYEERLIINEYNKNSLFYIIGWPRPPYFEFVY